MAKRRRTANPIFQKPLTTAEIDGEEVAGKAKGKPITCRICHSFGGTLTKVKNTDPQEYECQDKGKCNIMKLRRRVK